MKAFLSAATFTAALVIADPVAAQMNSSPVQQRAPTQPHQYIFSHHAAHNGLAEVMMSYLALQRSTNPAVRDFSQMMVDHHATSTAELMKLMGNNPIPLPIAPRPDQLAAMQRLAALSGPAFDRAYFDHQVAAHSAAVELYEQGARSAATPELARFAQMKLPLLRAHLAIAQMEQQTAMPRR